jgi:hypothetical protein
MDRLDQLLKCAGNGGPHGSLQLSNQLPARRLFAEDETRDYDGHHRQRRQCKNGIVSQGSAKQRSVVPRLLDVSLFEEVPDPFEIHGAQPPESGNVKSPLQRGQAPRCPA